MTAQATFPSMPPGPGEGDARMQERWARELAVLGEEAHRLRAAYAVLRVTGAALDEHALVRGVLEVLADHLATGRVEVVVRETGGYRHWDLAAEEPPPVETRAVVPHAEVLERSGPVVLREGIERVAGPARAPHGICVPLWSRGRVLGSLLVGRSGAAYAAQEVEWLEVLGRDVGAALERAREFRQAATEAERLERTIAERNSDLQAAQAQLARARWLTALGQLAAGVAHDLNNALNPIVAFGELIRGHAGEPEKVEQYVERILLAARDGAETVRRIQRFTRRYHAVAEPEPVAVAMTVRQALELTRPNWAERTGGGHVDVAEAVDPELIVLGNEGELRAVLLNLIVNALHAMPNGGTVRFVGVRAGADVMLAVQDTGTGMTRDVVVRALEPFFTTKGTRGTGLGLSEAYGIIRRHGGTLELESWPGVGTTVMIRLPAAETPARGQPMPDRSVHERVPTNILLVDDNLLSLEATAAALRAQGHTVVTASSAETALRVFEVGRYQVVLTDLGLPGQSGWQLLDQLRAIEPRLRIGIITGWSLQDVESELRIRGIDLAFVKPVDPERLLAAL